MAFFLVKACRARALFPTANLHIDERGTTLPLSRPQTSRARLRQALYVCHEARPGQTTGVFPLASSPRAGGARDGNGVCFSPSLERRAWSPTVCRLYSRCSYSLSLKEGAEFLKSCGERVSGLLFRRLNQCIVRMSERLDFRY